MVSPYLRLPIRTLEEVACDTAIIGSKAEYKPTDYRFLRQQEDLTPLEHTPPIQSWGAAILGGIMVASGIAGLFTAPWWAPYVLLALMSAGN